MLRHPVRCHPVRGCPDDCATTDGAEFIVVLSRQNCKPKTVITAPNNPHRTHLQNSAMSETVVKFERVGHVAVFTLDRPKAMNAVSGALSAQFEAHMDAFEADPELWVGVVAR